MSQSEKLFNLAKTLIPGGVNSPVRAFNAVGGTPPFIAKAKGAYLYDVDGHAYIDYVGSWGPMILGHAHPVIVEAVQKAAERGLSFGAASPYEVEFAEKINSLMPALEKIRLINSGTEATMTAIRLARGYTGRDKIIKFTGCYHGHSDALLVKAGSGALTFGTPSSAGVPRSVTQHTLTADFNHIESVRQLFDVYGKEIACVIVEPVAGNMNCILPHTQFLSALRKLCDEHGSLLIMDEVMTGFRVGLQGAQALYNVKPDLTTLGKIIGGGLPIAALGGRAEIMDHLAPLGPVYQAGTLSGNPLSVAAGLAMLNLISSDADLYPRLERKTKTLLTGLAAAAKRHDVPFHAHHVGSMFGLFFTKTPVTDYAQATQANLEHFNTFFHAMLKSGVYLAPSAYEAGFMSDAHGDEEIAMTVEKADNAFQFITDKAHTSDGKL